MTTELTSTEQVTYTSPELYLNLQESTFLQHITHAAAVNGVKIHVIDGIYQLDTDADAFRTQHLSNYSTDPDFLENTILVLYGDIVRTDTRHAATDYHISLDDTYDYIYNAPTSSTSRLAQQSSGLLLHTVNDIWDDASPTGTDLPLALYANNIIVFPGRIVHNSGSDSENFWNEEITDLVSCAINAPTPTETLQNNELELIVRIAQELTNYNDGQLISLNNTSRTLLDELENLRDQADTREARLRDIAIQIKNLQETRGKHPLASTDALQKMFADVEQIPQIAKRDIVPRDQTIVFRTAPLHMNVTMEDGHEYTSPAYEYDIAISLNNRTIVITNKTLRIDQYDHPHIAEGAFCLGGARNLVNNLLKDSQIPALLNVLIDQLQTVNPDDCYFSNWHDFFDNALRDYFEPDFDDDEE